MNIAGRKNLPAFLLLGLISLACSKNSNESDTAQPEEFPVVSVFKKDVTMPLEYVANIHAFQNVEIRARVEGYLEDILVDEGKQVTKGQLLFKINDEEYRAELHRAQANISSAEAETKSALVELERVRLLVNKNVITKTELDLAEAKLEIAKSRIEQAKAEATAASIKLANTSIRSPFNGTIDRIPFKKGSLINEGTLLTTISELDNVYAYFHVSEVEYLENFKRNRSGDALSLENIELYLADGSLYSQKGKIETMESEFEAGTGTLAVRARFNNREHLLKHGSTGKIRVNDERDGALLIPQKSTLEIQDKNYVFLLNKNQTVVMKSFVPVSRVGEYYVVSRGLEEGDQIVYEGIQNVREGMVIKPVAVSLEQLLKDNALIRE